MKLSYEWENYQDNRLGQIKTTTLFLSLYNTCSYMKHTEWGKNVPNFMTFTGNLEQCDSCTVLQFRKDRTCVSSTVHSELLRWQYKYSATCNIIIVVVLKITKNSFKKYKNNLPTIN